MTQISLIDDGHAAALERDRLHEVDRTPGPVAHQGVERAAEIFHKTEGRSPKTILDLGTGAGVFGQQERIVFAPGIELIGIEIREEEQGARRHYDRFIVGDALHPDVIDQVGDVDLVISNPKFTLWTQLLRAYLPRSRVVMFYGTIAWGCAEGETDEITGEGLTGAALFAELPPVSCDRVVGRVGHRGPGINPKTITKDCPNGRPWGADSQDNCFWTWRRGNTSSSWETKNFPVLTAAERRWSVPPGSEDACDQSLAMRRRP